jgi:phosphopantothenoylcysteine decarboxylase/phosphopantothenate--cysteine ligase
MRQPARAHQAPRIVVGVTGGIAAYKAVGLIRELVKAGATVTVIPTHSALKFVGLPTWEAISRNPVATELFEGVAEVRHVALGQNADLVIVAPASAHFLAQMAGGFASDLLGTTLLATKAPVLLAPAMHTEMWENPAVSANVSTLRSRGVHIVGPESGALTGGDQGPGRMSEPWEIAAAAFALLAPQTWAGKKVLVSAGGTRERLDPVRFLGNRSSGAMGVAIATAAARQGAEVVLVASNLEVDVPAGITVHDAPTAERVREAMLAHQPGSDLVVMAAAVADWVLEIQLDEKISKQDSGSRWSPTFVPAPDVLSELVTHKSAGQFIVGFAAETIADATEREERARAKMLRKGADALVLNQVGDEVGFGAVETAVTLFYQASPQSLSVEGTKDSIAERLLEALLDR